MAHARPRNALWPRGVRRIPPRTCIVTDESRSANAPPIETLHAHDLRDILGVQEGEHTYGCQQAEAAEPAGRVTSDERHDRAAGLGHRCRFVHARPLNQSHADVRGHVLAYWAMGAEQGQPCSWVTDVRVSTRTVSALMR